MQSVQKCAKMVCKNMEACHARALRWCAAKGKLLTRRSMIATCMTSRGLRPAVAQRTSGIHGAAASHALEGPLSLGRQIVPQYHSSLARHKKLSWWLPARYQISTANLTMSCYGCENPERALCAFG